MKNFKKGVLLMIVTMFFFPANAVLGAGGTPFKWVGNWTMHTSKGVRPELLKIYEIKADCAAPAWCSMRISLTRSNGKPLRARILKMDDKFRHMVFTVKEGRATHTFDVRIFAVKNKMAGSYSTRHTQWGGIPPGVLYGTKQRR